MESGHAGIFHCGLYGCNVSAFDWVRRCAAKRENANTGASALRFTIRFPKHAVSDITAAVGKH
jgi:hypothetical protein